MIERHESVVSTQEVARARAEAGAPSGFVVVAEQQTGGRGRRGRVWESVPGENLYLTVILRPDCLPREAPLLTLGAAAALAEALDVRVKWPNDLVDADGRKLGGLLAEMETQGDAIRYVLLGLGLNVNQTVFPGLPNATSLTTLRRAAQEREALLTDVVATLRAPLPGLDLWRSRSHTLGRQVRVLGTSLMEGVATGIRDDGALLVNGHPVTTGEVE